MPVTESLSTAVLVKETRKRLGLTQLQFAKTLGVSFQSVNRWERGKTKPLPIVLKQIEAMVKEMGALGGDCQDILALEVETEGILHQIIDIEGTAQ
jgi:transcriptional regulator with XRE-family HTH domain